MAIGFRAITQAASGGSSGASTVTAPALPTGTASGDMVVLVVAVKYASVTMTAPTNWTVASNNEVANSGLTDSGNDAGNVRSAVFFREYDGVWSMPTITLSGAADVTMRGAISYTKGGSEAWVTPVCASIADNTAATTGVATGNAATTVALVSGDWMGSVCSINGDAGTFSSHTMTVTGITFGTQNTRLGAAATTGTDMRIHSVDRPWSSGTATTGPAGNVALTSGAATGAGTFVFYRLRVGTTVAATMVSACGALAGTISATVQHPTTVAAVLAAPLGTLTATASATVIPRIEAALVAPLGGLNATATARRTLPAVLAAPMGGLTATASATVVPRIEAALVAPLGALSATAIARRTLPATMASSCGGLTATMAATVESGSAPTIPAVLVAPLGGVTVAATATRQHPVTALAACGGLTATAAATIQHSALGAAPLGTLTATMTATAGVATTVDAVLVADLGQLVAMANAGPPPRQSTFFPFYGRHDHPWEDVVRFAEGWPP